MREATGAIVLAAGASTRLGQPKQLVTLGSETLVRRAARLALEAGCVRVIVVLGACDQPCRAALAGLSGAEIVFNPAWQEGMGASLRAGILAMETAEPVGSVLITVVDQVRVAGMSLARLLDQHRLGTAPATAACYGGRLGVPAVFGRELFATLAELRGDQGARSVLAQAGSKVTSVDLPEAEFDLDTPEDLAGLG